MNTLFLTAAESTGALAIWWAALASLNLKTFVAALVIFLLGYLVIKWACKLMDKLLQRNQGIVRHNLAILDAWVQSQPHVRYTKPKAGTTALVYYDYEIPSRELCIDMYNRTGAFVTPGDCFEQGRSMRIGYACDEQVLRDGLKAIDEYFALLDGEGK